MKVKMSERDEKLYSKLGASQTDLEMARYCLEIIIERGLHHTRHGTDEVTYLEQSVYTCGLVVSYGRVFAGSNQFPKFPDRLKQYSPKETVRHRVIMQLRNEVFAHTDGEHNYTGHYRSEEFETPLKMRPMMRIDKEDSTMLKGMIARLLSNIESRMEEMRAPKL